MLTEFLFCYSNQISDFQKLKTWKFGLHLFDSPWQAKCENTAIIIPQNFNLTKIEILQL